MDVAVVLARRVSVVLGVGLMLAAPVRVRAQARRGAGTQGVLANVVTEGARIDDRREVAPEPTPAPSSRSIGVPDRGRLQDGVQLGSTPHLFLRDGRREAMFGTEELVGLIGRAAAAVGESQPGPKLIVGDLSRARGGRLHPHRSHRSGRDVDLGFYLVDEEGHSVQAARFVNLRRNGCGRIGEQRYCFDAARNWALVAAAVMDPVARVQYVLVAPDIRRRLLAEGERIGAPAELRERVSTVTAPHSGSHAHRSHFHVRIYCSVGDRPECIDEPPYYDWYEGEPAPPTPTIRRIRVTQRRAARRRAARQQARTQARARARRARRSSAAPSRGR